MTPALLLHQWQWAPSDLAALRNNATAFYEWLTPIWERDVISLFGPEQVLDKKRVIFDWVENT